MALSPARPIAPATRRPPSIMPVRDPKFGFHSPRRHAGVPEPLASQLRSGTYATKQQVYLGTWRGGINGTAANSSPRTPDSGATIVTPYEVCQQSSITRSASPRDTARAVTPGLAEDRRGPKRLGLPDRFGMRGVIVRERGYCGPEHAGLWPHQLDTRHNKVYATAERLSSAGISLPWAQSRTPA